MDHSKDQVFKSELAPAMEQPLAQTSEMVLEIPDYPVKIWEFAAVGLAGLGLVGVAVIGLANQLFTKMQDAKQAESIVRSVVDYQIPGGAKGLMSLSIGAEAFALVGSQRNPNEVLLLVTQTSIGPDEEEPRNFAQEIDLQTTLIGTWRSENMTNKSLPFCGQQVPVEIRQGQFQLIEQKQPVPAIEYTWHYSHHQTLNHIHLMTTGPDATSKIEQVFKTLQCRKAKS
jgi:hypothetical protein